MKTKSTKRVDPAISEFYRNLGARVTHQQRVENGKKSAQTLARRLAAQSSK
jgi:hypothetical protein